MDNIEIINGKASFFSNREIPWHSLGTITDGALTVDEALDTAGLNWTVTKSDEPVRVPVLTETGVTDVAFPERFITYRDHPVTGLQALGVVGPAYQVIQNVEAFDFLNNIVDESGAVFETAGSLSGGRQVFVSMRMPNHITLGGGQDTVDMYLMAATSHDGTQAFTATVSPIRPVCANTVRMNIAAAVSTWRLKHTTNVKGKVAQAREALGIYFEYADAFEQQVHELAAAPFTEAEFQAFVDSLITVPKKATDRQVTNALNTRSAVKAMWNAPTQDNIRGTKWAAWNSVTEWADWGQRIRSKDDDKMQVRAQRILLGQNDGIKQRALALLAR